MSRYIDVEPLMDDIEKSRKLYSKLGETHNRPITLDSIEAWLDSAPTADVVGRDQYNECYEEGLKLRCLNEHLMDILRSYGEVDV